MTGDPLARPPEDQQVADRHPRIPQESLIALGDLVDPCPACNAEPDEDCRPWCTGEAAALDLGWVHRECADDVCACGAPWPCASEGDPL